MSDTSGEYPKSLTPITRHKGRRLEFDFPAVQIGAATYPEGPTGCTVVYLPGGGFATVDLATCETGTINTDPLRLTGCQVDAIVLAGGSLYGFEAVTGVSAELYARGGFSHAHGGTAMVSGAITFDFIHRNNPVYPDKALGRAALLSARTGVCPLGRFGSGSNLKVGKGISLEHGEYSGLGAAFRQFGPTRLLVLTNVNSAGAIVDRSGNVVRGNLDPQTGKHYHLWEAIQNRALGQTPQPGRRQNTTISILVTNEKLGFPALRQLARQVHTSMARGIQPFQTQEDGDTFFAVTTNEVSNPSFSIANGLGDYSDLGVVAAEVAWDAILSCYDE